MRTSRLFRALIFSEMATPEQKSPAMGSTTIQKRETATIRKGSTMMAWSSFAPNELGVVDAGCKQVAVIGLPFAEDFSSVSA